MYKSKKLKKLIEENQKQLENIKYEKEELLEIKKILEDNSSKIDITNVFVFKRLERYDIVELRIEKIQGTTIKYGNRIVNGFHSQLVNIFSNVIEYEKINLSPIQDRELVSDRYGKYYEAFLYPITDIDKSLLKYVDNKVPMIELQKLFYRLNNVEITKDIKTLKKDK